ncbi:MAG: chromate resistance protein [Deltaproteobacteria bacterium]|nr:chromate resistance protein [Deltaproteobacteria bacterium]
MDKLSDKTKVKEDMAWLLFFYTVPSKPVSSRMRIWRRLAKTGAIAIKDAVYILPYNDEHYELLQWLVSEITAMKGDAGFVKVSKIETMKNEELVEFFNRQRESDFRGIQTSISEMEQKINSVKKDSASNHLNKLSERFKKTAREFEEIRKIDFFGSRAGSGLQKRLGLIEKRLKKSSDVLFKDAPVTVRRIEDYQGKAWFTRKKPFVDRMASAWLIKRFIDNNAVFKFTDESVAGAADKKSVFFDMRGGEFTHAGSLCTFEAIISSFGIKDPAAQKIAEIVHELDVKDNLYENPDSSGVEEILNGIRKTAKSDEEMLKKGMEVFEMLYISKGGGDAL